MRGKRSQVHEVKERVQKGILAMVIEKYRKYKCAKKANFLI